MVRLEHVNMVFNQDTPDENHALKDINLTIQEGDNYEMTEMQTRS